VSPEKWSYLRLMMRGEIDMMWEHLAALERIDEVLDRRAPWDDPLERFNITAEVRELAETLAAYKAFEPKAWWRSPTTPTA